MMTSPIAPKPATALLGLWLILASVIPTTAKDGAGRSDDNYGDYRDYLTFCLSRIDAESHPDPASQEAAGARIAALADKIASLDIEGLLRSIRASGRDRQRILQMLRAQGDQASAESLEAEARQLRLATALAEAPESPEAAAQGEAIENLDRRIAWLRERVEFTTGQIIAISSEPGESAGAAELYAKLIRLEEARCRAEALTNPQERRLAVATVERQQQRLRGKDLESARRALTQRQRTLAARELKGKLRTIPARPQAMAESQPEKSRQLLALQLLYTGEIEALQPRPAPAPAE